MLKETRLCPKGLALRPERAKVKVQKTVKLGLLDLAELLRERLAAEGKITISEWSQNTERMERGGPTFMGIIVTYEGKV